MPMRSSASERPHRTTRLYAYISTGNPLPDGAGPTSLAQDGAPAPAGVRAYFAWAGPDRSIFLPDHGYVHGGLEHVRASRVCRLAGRRARGAVARHGRLAGRRVSVQGGVGHLERQPYSEI